LLVRRYRSVYAAFVHLKELAMRRSVSPFAVIAAAGTVMALSGAAQAQQLVNVSGSSLLGSFIRGQASTNDYIGVREQAPAPGRDLISSVTSPTFNAVWAVNYRVSGSINGFDELLQFGAPQFVQAADNRIPGNTTALNSLLLTDEWYNRAQYITAGVTGGSYTALNPGGQPQRAATGGADRSIVGTNPTGGVTIDVAYLDVPAIWGVRSGAESEGEPTDKPNTSGYGTNPRLSRGLDGSLTGSASGGGFSNQLSTLAGRNLADFPGRNPAIQPYDPNTVFEYPVTLAPIAPVANPGAGVARMKTSELRHLFATGRTINGENLVVATRDIGSGTRNAFNNYIGLDPSFGVGDNIGQQSTQAFQDQLGPNFWPTNKGATSGMLRTLRYHRLAVGYAGAETMVSGSSPSTWNGAASTAALDIVDTFNDIYYTPAELSTLFPSGPSASDYKRPTLSNILRNDRSGWVINGQAVIATIGDPKAESATVRTAIIPNDGGVAANSANPKMVNKSAARYVNNILTSINDFTATTPVSQLVATPAEFLASNFTLIGAATNVIDQSSYDPTSRVINPLNPNPSVTPSFAQQYAEGAGNSVFQNARYAVANTGQIAGLSSRRQNRSTTASPAGDGVAYSDGNGNNAGNQNYTTQSGALVSYEANPALNGEPVMNRNKIAYDFNGDGLRTLADATDMIAAWRQRNGGPAWAAPTGAAGNGLNAVIEILGDGNGDGSFTSSDIRYWADGLALVGGKLDRKAGFTAVDDAFAGNFFSTAFGPGSEPALNPADAFGAGRVRQLKPYANGDSRADIASASGNSAPGWAPVGADGRVDGRDITYVQRQIAASASGDWAVLNDAVKFDLSADINGDLKVSQADVNELVVNVLGTTLGDVNLDGRVNNRDRAIVVANQGQSGTNAFYATGDVNGDGIIDNADIQIVCPADFSRDGSRNIDDIFIYINAFFQAGSGSLRCDITDDGIVNIDDLFVFINVWFAGC
jgi:hypothetical protein